MADSDHNTKRCPSCGAIKPLTEFYPDKKLVRGVACYCKVCHRAKRAARVAASPGIKREYDRAYRLRHGDVLRKREAEARKANPEIARRKNLACVKWVAANPERRKAYQTAYRAANHDSLREHARAHNQKNSAKNVARAAAWVKNNPERAKAAKRILRANRRAQKLAKPGRISAGDIADIRRMQGDKCGACRVALHGKGHLDHIVALTKGGAHDRRNAQLLCQSCNSVKSARDPIEFMQSRGFLL